ncbi:hypothetical protein [Luteolibacter sp. Populi]|uniref:hypothetical protein n=1 Tax=Luteolibacter sp. Populi TaxID=3230487 RepID=UPI003465862A
MKANLPAVFAALLIGIAAGWMLRGGGGAEGQVQEAGVGTVKAQQGASATAMAGQGEGGEAEPGKSRVRPPAGEKKPEIMSLKYAEKMAEVMQEQQDKRNEVRIASLVAKLGLNAQQEAKLRDYFDKQTPNTTVTTGVDGKGVMVDRQLPESKGSLDDLMKDLLSTEQAEDYAKLKEAERNQKIEARALREMASLNEAVEIRPDQRDAVYEILQNEARNETGNESALELVEGFGLTSHMEIGGVAEVSKVVAVKAAGGGPVNHEDAMSRMREEHQARVDAKVNRMNGVLDAAQLAQYRGHLEQGSLMFAP